MDDAQAPPMLTDLTDLERQVVDAARRGEFTRPAATVAIEDLAVTDDPKMQVRAELLRELLRGLHDDLDPRGIQVEGVRVVGQLDLNHVTAVTGLILLRCALPDGIVCRNAHLRDLYLNGSLFTHLDAEGLRTVGGLFARDATITAARKSGAIRLLGAHIGGQLGLERATITNTIGPALHADRLRTVGSMYALDATITAAGESGAIRLLGAHIGGQAVLLVSQLDNSSGPLLLLSEAQITGALLLRPTVVCPPGRESVSRSGCPHSDRIITAHGLTYPMLRETSWRQWLHLLVHHTPTYWPQPFQQLAATERAAGHDNNAREVLISQQHDLRQRAPHALGNRLARWRHWLWGWLGRYGYRAHRLVLALGVVLALAAGLGLVAGHLTTYPGHHAAERVPPPTAKPDTPGTPCSPVELIGLGIDRGLPLGTTGLRARCDLDTATGWGQTFTVTLWGLQALLWGLATLAIAAYTGLVRKPT